MASQSNKPTYKRNQRAGYDRASRRWRLASGDIRPKAEVLAALADGTASGAERYGFYFEPGRDSEERAWRVLEDIVSAGERGQSLVNDPRLKAAGERANFIAGFMAPDKMPPQAKAEPIPGAIRAAYNLVDYYYDRHGDVAQSIEAPIDLSLGKLEIQGEYKNELDDLYGRTGLNMAHVLFQVYYSTAKYGVAYPLEMWQGKDPLGVTLLPSRYMWVGYQATQRYLFEQTGKNTDLPPAEQAALALRPLDNSPTWTQDLLNTLIQPISYGPVADTWRNQNPGGSSWGLPVPLEFLDPVRDKSLDYERYPMPALSRAFGSLSTRMIFHEARRAILEGHKSQLWLFVLGEKDRPPGADEMLAFKSAINGMTGHRTGNLVWRFGADGKVLTPNALQGMLANEASVLFDLACYRDLGMNIRLMTGNAAGVQGGGGEGLDIDLSMLLRRLEFARTRVLNWEEGFRLRAAKRLGGASAVKAARKTSVSFLQSLLEIGEIVKKEIQPMYQIGLYSPQTALARVGKSYDGELANKKIHKPNEELFFPSPTYNQTAQGMGGQRTTNASSPQGRPVSPSKLKAAWDEDPDRSLHIQDVLHALADWIGGGETDHFIQSMATYNYARLGVTTERGYQAAGGVVGLPVETRDLAATFVNAYLPRLHSALASATQRDDPKLIARVLLYPQEGYKMAILNGQARAMAERGAQQWKRVLKAHGCPDCVADAQLTHSIDEPFRVLHPNEDCAGETQYIQYFIGGLPSIEILVPGAREDYADLVEQVLGASTSRSRRRRSA